MVKQKDVSQDEAILGPFKEICYATDENGSYVLEPSAGWEPANVANAQAWEDVRARVARAVDGVRAGILSPLAVHMERALMEEKLLAAYGGVSRWTLRKHLKPRGYARLDEEQKRRYAKALGIAPEKLDEIPEPQVGANREEEG